MGQVYHLICCFTILIFYTFFVVSCKIKSDVRRKSSFDTFLMNSLNSTKHIIFTVCIHFSLPSIVLHAFYPNFFQKKYTILARKSAENGQKRGPKKPAGLSGRLGQPKNRPGGRAKPENQNITNFFLRLKNPIVFLSYIVTILSRQYSDNIVIVTILSYMTILDSLLATTTIYYSSFSLFWE